MECEHSKLWLLFLLLSFDDFVPTSAHPLLVLDKWFVYMYLNVSSNEFVHILQDLWVLVLGYTYLIS